jgi:hypothetical protein
MTVSVFTATNPIHDQPIIPQAVLEDSWKQCQDADVLIESPSAMAGVHIAEALSRSSLHSFPFGRLYDVISLRDTLYSMFHNAVGISTLPRRHLAYTLVSDGPGLTNMLTHSSVLRLK